MLLAVAAAAALAAAAVSLWQGPATRLGVGAGLLVIRYWPGLVLLLAAMLLVVLATRQGRDQQPREADSPQNLGEPRWPWVLSDSGVWTVAGTVLTVGVVALAVMWQIAEHVPVGERGQVQIDAIKYGLGFVAAAGAAVALLLGVRRQQLAEHSHRLELRKQSHTETDAAARRVTELYTKAVEQLGSADAAVRLGGLYALERVAQENPTQRQTIVDVICAYLRMPYTAHTEPDPAPASEQPATGLPLAPRSPGMEGTRDARQELQVRLTAQRLLTAHLRPLPDTESTADPRPASFWPDIDLDLTGAHLINWELTECRLRNGTFAGATFTGRTNFGETTLTGRTTFSGATFTDQARFFKADFTVSTFFVGTTFSRRTDFGGATFNGGAYFIQAAFSGRTDFGAAAFNGAADFTGATFSTKTSFRKATFTAKADFTGATFSEGADFPATAFGGGAFFAGATFTGRMDFSKATFSGRTTFSKATFSDRTTFRGRDSWPAGWRLAPSLDGLELVYDQPDKNSQGGQKSQETAIP